MQKTVIVLVACIATIFFNNLTSAQIHSDLWGKNGEKWTPKSRLPDFSFAGYHFGDDPIPQLKIVANVKNFGAKGDGKADDTDAFKRAIKETKQGAILIPEGNYLISDIIWIDKPNIVLRGEGTDKTILHITCDLEDVRPNMRTNAGGRPTSGYSWSGGFIWVKGHTKSTQISAITSEPKRGERVLTLKNASNIKVGQRVQVCIKDDAQKSLLAHLYSNDSGNTDMITHTISVQMVSRVSSINGNTISLERPLRWDIRNAWQPRLKTFTPSVSEVGIENFSINFPVKPYKGHFTEKGMNAIAMNGVSDCWVRNIRISDCDSGIFLGGNFCTIDELLIDGVREATRGDTGHHGVTMGRDCMLQNFDIQTKFIHDITMSNFQVGNVVKNGKGTNLSFDHHRRCPYENLFCNIDVGNGSQVWRCGGGHNLGKNCAARGTFWCIRSDEDIDWPRDSFGPDSINIVGVKTESESIKTTDGKWFESIPPDKLYPADIHAAQLSKRLNTK